MRIDPKVSNHDPVAWGLQKASKLSAKNTTSNQAFLDGQATDTQTNIATEQDSGQKGVIRNLLNGHYKGVADVRLRINFHEELSALESGQVKQALSQPLETLGDLGSDLKKLQTLEAALPEDSELVGQIKDMLAKIEALSQPGELKVSEANSAISDLKAGLDDLLKTINSYLEQIKPAEPAEELLEPNMVQNLGDTEAPEQIPALAEGEQPLPNAETPLIEPVEEQTPETQPSLTNQMLTEFLEKWQQASGLDDEGPLVEEIVEDELILAKPMEASETQGSATPNAYDLLMAELDELTVNLSQVTVLPPLSEAPDNNGVAYSKFLSILRELNGQGNFNEVTQNMATGTKVDTVV